MYLPDERMESIVEAVASLGCTPSDVVLVLVGAGSQDHLQTIHRQLVETGVRFAGAVFPGVVSGGRYSERGLVLIKLPLLAGPFLLTDLQHGGAPLECPADLGNGGRPTLIALYDGLSAGIARFVELLYARFGQSVRYFGGGAGQMDAGGGGPLIGDRGAVILDSSGWHQDAAVVFLVDLEAQLGVAHGWRSIAGPLVASRVRGLEVLELDWEPAFEVYRRVVEQDAGQPVSRAQFFELARRYPVGMVKEGEDCVVRLVGGVTDREGLILGADVHENSGLDVLRGDPEMLLDAARRAARDCLAGRTSTAGVLMSDCISRQLIFGEAFVEEIAVVDEELERIAPGQCCEGFLSMGELGSDGRRVLEPLNKTVVLASLHAR